MCLSYEKPSSSYCVDISGKAAGKVENDHYWEWQDYSVYYYTLRGGEFEYDISRGGNVFMTSRHLDRICKVSGPMLLILPRCVVDSR